MTSHSGGGGGGGRTATGLNTLEKKFLTSGERSELAKRTGARATIYDVQRDPQLKNKDVIRDKTQKVFPFIGGDSYKGEWNEDKKEGFGCALSVDGTKYEGEWRANRKHGRGTLYILKKKKYIKKYVGEWSQDRRSGYGVCYNDNGNTYRGNWSNDQMSGDGRMDFSSGDYYTGEWENDIQKGFGTMHYKNGNKYEGLWLNGMKEGPGRFFYAATHKVYDGEWCDDNPKCGEYREPSSEEVERFGSTALRKEIFSLPDLTLSNARSVIDLSVSSVRLDNAMKRGIINRNIFSQDHLEAANNVFTQLDSRSIGILPWFKSSEVFRELGLDTSKLDMKQIVTQLEMGTDGDLTFPEIVDIAMCLSGQ